MAQTTILHRLGPSASPDDVEFVAYGRLKHFVSKKRTKQNNDPNNDLKSFVPICVPG